ncbi:MAG: hypothetical protein O3C34_08175 [Proteobacteria bacterium]|nr:hypothetical protein [Pseudomonadota bacterium]
MRWSHIVGQFGGKVKVYSNVSSCRQNPVYHILLLLLSRPSPAGYTYPKGCDIGERMRGIISDEP